MRNYHDIFFYYYCFFQILDRRRRFVFRVRRERRSISNNVLKTRRIQNSKNKMKNNDVHCRENFRVDNNVRFEKIDENNVKNF